MNPTGHRRLACCTSYVVLSLAVALLPACSARVHLERENRAHWFHRRELRKSSVAIVPCIFTDKGARSNWPDGLVRELMRVYVTRGRVWRQKETLDAMGIDGVVMMNIIAPEFASAKRLHKAALKVLVSTIRKKLPAVYICLVEVKELEVTESEEEETEVETEWGPRGVTSRKERTVITDIEKGHARLCLAFVRTRDLSVGWIAQATGRWRTKHSGYEKGDICEYLASRFLDALVLCLFESLFRTPRSVPTDASLDGYGRSVKAAFLGIMENLPER